MEPETFRVLVTWGTLVALFVGVVIGAIWPFTSRRRMDSDAEIKDPALRRWSRKVEATAGVVAVILGTVLAATGGYYFGRPFDFYAEPGTLPDPHDLLDLAIAIAGVCALGFGGFVLSQLETNIYLGRR